MSIIPKNLIVFYHETKIPEFFQESLSNSIAANPEYKIIILDDEKVKILIGEYFPHFQKIYGQISIPAARSDIARLLALYHWGGVYIDIAMAFDVSLHSLFGENDELFLVRRDDFYKGKTDIAHMINGIIAAPSKSDFIISCLKRIYFNISSGHSNLNVFFTTGPGVITNEYFMNRVNFKFPYTIENFSKLYLEKFKYKRIEGISNSWTKAQHSGIMINGWYKGETSHDKAWREFSEKPRS